MPAAGFRPDAGSRPDAGFHPDALTPLDGRTFQRRQPFGIGSRSGFHDGLFFRAGLFIVEKVLLQDPGKAFIAAEGKTIRIMGI